MLAQSINRIVALPFFALALAINAPAFAEVYRCVVDGKTVYGDRPCAPDAKRIVITQDPNAPLRGNLIPGTKLAVSDEVMLKCWEGFRGLCARSPLRRSA